MIDEPSKHFPDRIVGELQIDPDNMAKSTGVLDSAVPRRQEYLAPGP